MKYYHWTSNEIARLKRDYETMSKEELIEAFAPHPLTSIRNTARSLGLGVNRKKRKWATICASHIMQTKYFKGNSQQ